MPRSRYPRTVAGRRRRRRQLAWLKLHRGVTENPPGSNRGGAITVAQRALGAWLIGLAWCGVWVGAGLRAAGVNLGARPWHLASVEQIEDEARACHRPWLCWLTPAAMPNWRRQNRGGLRGAAVVLFGRGVHVETVRWYLPLLGVLITDGGNTSSGDAGSQSNGGGAFRRVRRLRDVHGFAIPDYSRP
jgi:hypothetical protein